MYRVHPARIAAAALIAPAALWLSACNEPSASSGSGDTAVGGASSNELRLTRTQSLRLVAWATSFRRCMLEGGTYVGELAKSETHISMAVAEDVVASDILPPMTHCGDKQGGPPQKSSLQYRGGQILLYLPRQRLLDAKVAAT